MMGASGGAAALGALSMAAASRGDFVGGELGNAISAPTSPPLSSLWASCRRAVSPALVPVAEGTAKGGSGYIPTMTYVRPTPRGR